MSEIILIDINAHTGAAPVTLRYATQGYVSPAPRTNIALMSEAFDNPNWSKAEISATANAATAPNGSVTADKIIASVNNLQHYIYQQVAITAAVKHTISVYAKASDDYLISLWSSGTGGGFPNTGVSFNLTTGVIHGTTGTGIGKIEPVGDGWYRCSVVIIANAALIATWGYANHPSSDSGGYPVAYIGDGVKGVFVWGAQLEAGGSVSAYIPTTVGMATSFPGLTTNFAKYSEQFDNAAGWSASNITFTPNATVAPDGQTTAELFTATATTTLLLTQNIVAASTVYTYSIFVKQGTRPIVRALLRNSTTATNFDSCIFDFSTPTLSGGAGWIVQAVGNGWYRLSYTRSTGITIGDTLVMYAGSTGDVVTAGLTWYMWGAQLEAGPALNNYVGPTTTVPVTGGTGNAYYEGRIKQPGNIQRTIFSGGATFGASKVGYGEVVLVNNDGALDAFLTYGFAGFGITIQRGTMAQNQSVPTWTTVLTGTMDSVDFSWSEVSIKVRDRQQELTKPLQQTRYGGTNSLPNGLDGVATDIKGNGRPILYGRVYNIAPPRVNTTRIIFELSEGVIQSVDAVYDRGTALTAGAAYASQADMETNAPAAGQYRAWLNAAGSYIRLGSEPVGTVTVDATQGAAVANRTPAQLMKQVLLKGGILNADITAADVTALDTAATVDCGYWVSDSGETTGIEVLDALANSAGAWWGVDRLGKFRMGQIVAPSSGNSIGTLSAVEITKVDRVRSSDQGGGVPAWQVKVNYARMFTVQSDLAAAVPTVLKSDRAEEYRAVLANDAAVKTQWPKAVEIEFNTHLVSSSDAATEATRRLNLYKVRRDTLQARVKLSDALAAAIDLGKTVMVELPRFGMSAGKPFLVTGIRTDLRNNTFDLTLWG